MACLFMNPHNQGALQCFGDHQRSFPFVFLDDYRVLDGFDPMSVRSQCNKFQFILLKELAVCRDFGIDQEFLLN